MHPSKDDPQRPGRLRELAIPEATCGGPGFGGG